MFAALFRIALSCVSKVLFADAVTSPSSSAVIVATNPIPSRTTSWDSLLRCGAGSQLRMNVPATAHPNVTAKVIDAMMMAVKATCILTPRRQGGPQPGVSGNENCGACSTASPRAASDREN